MDTMPASWNIGSFHPNNRQYTAQTIDKPPLAGMGLPPRHATSKSGLPGKSPGVFPEDHFRCMKENKQIMSNYQKTFKKKTDMAMSRFDNDQNLAAQMPGGAANALVDENPGLGPLAKRLMMDPDITQAEALSLIVLPPETIYLIDKVVRQKARAGPIGIDCSEVINIEMENEFKAKNKHIYKLNNGEMDDEAAEELADGYIDSQGVYHGMDQDKRLFQQNEKLLQRLTKAAAKENDDLQQQQPPAGNSIDQTAATDIISISGNQGASNVDPSALVSNHVQQPSYDAASKGPHGQSKSSLGGKSAVQPSSLAGQASHATKVLELQAKSVKVSHGEWVRRKNHETKLRGKLILEAKRDLLETLIQKQEEEAIRMQQRSHQMLEWDSRKKMHIQHKKLVKLQKEEKERLEKKQKQDISFLKFKEWLKQSLIKQREEQMGKKIEKHNKKVADEEEKRRKKHREVLAKIAYKDWKQTKMEEEKLRKKREQIERRQGLFDSKSFRQKPSRPKMTRHSSARGFAPSQNSSRYINTDQKRNQIETRGGQANILAYSLNKNMKKTRPKTAGKTRAAPKPKRASSYNRAQQQNQQQQQNTYNGYFYGQQPQYGQNQVQQQNYMQQVQQQQQQQYSQQMADEQNRQDIYFQNQQQHLQEPINEQEEDESNGHNQMQQQQMQYDQEDDEYGDEQVDEMQQQQQLQDQREQQEAQQLLQNHQMMDGEEDQMDEDEDQMQQMVQDMDDMEGEDMMEGESYDQNLRNDGQFQQQMLDMEGFEDEDNEQQEYDGEMMDDGQEEYDEEYIRQVQMQALQQQQQMMMHGQMEGDDGEEYAPEDDEEDARVSGMYQQHQM